MKIMKKTTLILAVTLILGAILIAFWSINRSKSSNGVAANVSESEYVIGVYQEKIAVFAQGDKIPIEVYDVYVSTLPEKDRQDLYKGVKVLSKAELKLKIEDYTS